MKINTSSPIQTKKIAAKLAKEILKSKPHKKHARVIALVGDLGAGKTTFVQGFAKALGIKQRMVSPTFLIFRSYEISGIGSKQKVVRYKKFYHVDTYRVHSPKELNVLDFKSLLLTTNAILLIEWADQIKKILPKDTIWVHFTHGRKETERIITY